MAFEGRAHAPLLARPLLAPPCSQAIMLQANLTASFGSLTAPRCDSSGECRPPQVDRTTTPWMGEAGSGVMRGRAPKAWLQWLQWLHASKVFDTVRFLQGLAWSQWLRHAPEASAVLCVPHLAVPPPPLILASFYGKWLHPDVVQSERLRLHGVYALTQRDDDVDYQRSLLWQFQAPLRAKQGGGAGAGGAAAAAAAATAAWTARRCGREG